MVLGFGCLDRLAIAKSERNVGKGARAARIQRNKMVFFCFFDPIVSYALHLYFRVTDYEFFWQIRDQKRAAVLKEKRELSGSRSPPRVIVSESWLFLELDFAICFLDTHFIYLLFFTGSLRPLCFCGFRITCWWSLVVII